MSFRVVPVRRRSSTMGCLGARACWMLGHSWFSGRRWRTQWVRPQYRQT